MLNEMLSKARFKDNEKIPRVQESQQVRQGAITIGDARMSSLMAIHYIAGIAMHL